MTIVETNRSKVVYTGDNHSIVWFDPDYQYGPDYRGVPGMVAGRHFFVEVRPDEWRCFKLGSVISEAQTRGRCPIEAVEKAKAAEYDLHWIECATLPSAWAMRDSVEIYAGFKPGEKLRFQGRIFSIVRNNGGGISLYDHGTGRE